MGKWFRIFAILICTSFLLQGPKTALSLDREKVSKKILKDALAKSLINAGISEESRFYRLYMGTDSSSNDAEYESEFWKVTKNLSQDVIQHLRSDKGEEFTAASTKDDDKKAIPFKRPDMREQILEASRKEWLAINMPGQKMPDCKENKTDETVGDGPQLGEKEAQLLDILFARKKDIPLDAELKLGDNVEINIFDEQGKSAASTAIKGAGIPCLPFRIRAIGNKVFKDYGKNALKFYGTAIKEVK